MPHECRSADRNGCAGGDTDVAKRGCAPPLSGFAQATAASGAPPRDPARPRTAWRCGLGIIPPIGLGQVGFTLRSAALAANRRDALHQRHELREVVAIGFGQNGRERNALSVGEEVVFAARRYGARQGLVQPPVHGTPYGMPDCGTNSTRRPVRALAPRMGLATPGNGERRPGHGWPIRSSSTHSRAISSRTQKWPPVDMAMGRPFC